MWFEIWKGRKKSSPKGRFEPGSITSKWVWHALYHLHHWSWRLATVIFMNSFRIRWYIDLMVIHNEPIEFIIKCLKDEACLISFLRLYSFIFTPSSNHYMWRTLQQIFPIRGYSPASLKPNSRVKASFFRSVRMCLCSSALTRPERHIIQTESGGHPTVCEPLRRAVCVIPADVWIQQGDRRCIICACCFRSEAVPSGVSCTDYSISKGTLEIRLCRPEEKTLIWYTEQFSIT